MNFAQRGSSFFKKASPVFSNLFQKARQVATQVASQAPQVARDILSTAKQAPQVGRDIASKAREGLAQASPIFGNVGRLLNEGGNIARRASNNPELVNINSPTLQKGLGFLNRAGETAQRGSGLAHGLDTFVREGSYNKGSHEANLTNALERAKGLKQQASNIFV